MPVLFSRSQRAVRDYPDRFAAAAASTLLLALLLTLLVTHRAPAARQTSPPRPLSPPGDRGLSPEISFPDTLLVQNGGPVIDVERPPEAGMRAARGDGRTDDTATFQDTYDFLKRKFKQYGGWDSRNSFYVYLPAGTYRVSDTLIYRGPTVGAYPRWDGTFDINHIHIVGESRAHTIIRLTDHAPGFGDPAHPKILLAYQHPDTVFNNLPGGNILRNVTLDTGRGNPGAVALDFQGANQTDLRGVTIRSEDGAGKYGIWFKTGSVQGYCSDVTVEGFQDGIFDPVNPEGDPAFEHLSLRSQKQAGILHTGGGMSLRQVLSDQRHTGAPALRLDGSGAQSVILDSMLDGRSRGPAIDLTQNQDQCLFARNVSTRGYGAAIRRAGTVVARAPLIGEYVSYPVTALFPGQRLHSLRLPIEETPAVPWFNPARQWAVVDAYPSVQAAMNSGKPVVCFKRRSYRLTADVHVPASVRFINGMYARVDGGAFVVDRPSANPILVQDSTAPIRVVARRNIIQRCASGGISNPRGLPVTFFLENVNDNTTGDDFCRPGQHVYARQIDVEYGGGRQIVSSGGSLWIFGYKTENGAATPFTVKNGGSLEVLGGYSNTTNMPPPGRQNPLLENDDSNVSATLFTNLGAPFVRTIVETRGAETRTALSTSFPLRGGNYRRDIVVPLYAGYHL